MSTSGPSNMTTHGHQRRPSALKTDLVVDEAHGQRRRAPGFAARRALGLLAARGPAWGVLCVAW